MPTTIDDLIKEVRRLAAEKPDYVYPINDADFQESGAGIACWYQAPGKTRCIFGQALANLGVTLPYNAEGQRIRLVIAGSDLVTYNPRSDTEKIHWCTGVQNAQDRGKTWGQAIADADGMAEQRVGP
jgi:hypothetical protein